MASVWEAHDELLARSVAVKLLAQHLSEDERARQRFQREARAAAGLSNHPHVVTIYDVGEHDGRVFMVMELLTGGTVAEKLRGDASIAPETALRWLHDAASALDAAHDAGVVHRDVKPANMLLDERGRLALADFGIARLALEDQLTATGQVLGTAAYISPEQADRRPRHAPPRTATRWRSWPTSCSPAGVPSRPSTSPPRRAPTSRTTPPPASERNPQLAPEVDAVLARGHGEGPERALGQRRGAGRRARRRAQRAGRSGHGRGRGGAAADGRHPRGRRHGRGDAHPAAATGPAAAVAAASAARAGAPGPPGGRRLGSGALLAGLAGDRSCWAWSPSCCSPAATTAERRRHRRPPERFPEGGRDTRTPTATAEPAAQDEPEAGSTPDATPEPDSGGGDTGGGAPDLDGRAAAPARRLQRAPTRATSTARWTLSEQALEACGSSRELEPCGYALFEKGVALNRSGRPDEAIPVLEQRLEQYGDNGSGEVEKELKDAKKAARKGDG